MSGLALIVFLLFSFPQLFHTAPIPKGVSQLPESTPQTTTAPPPLMPTVPANKHGILIWMCQNSEVLKIVDEVKVSGNVTDLPSLTKDVYDRLNEYRPNGLWAVYSTKYTTRSTANLLSNDGESFPSALCFVQFHENPQILVVANLAEVI